MRPPALLRAACVALPLLVTAASRADAQSLDSTRVDALLAPYAAEAPGVALLVVRDGQPVLRRVRGSARLETGELVTTATSFRLASLTKQLTAAAVLLLARDGRLALDEPIARVLPELAGVADGVTVRHLLTHASGLWDYEALIPDTQTVQVRDGDVPRLLAAAPGRYFAPGTRYRYSNTGYALLALAVERRAGASFPAVLRELIFAPLDMRAVAHVEGEDTVAHRAYGYVRGDTGGWRPRDQSLTSAVLGDGGVYASIDDLARWYAALDAASLLRADELALAGSAAPLADGTPGPYGLGWFVDEDGGRRRLTHHGETSGFTNAVVRYPDERLTVVVLTNRAGGAPWRLAQAVADLVRGVARDDSARAWPFERVGG